MATDEERAKFAAVLAKTERGVFFGGAGVSTESGIPDFRSATGIYSMKYKQTLSPEKVVSHSFFMRCPEEFYEFYRKYLVYPNAKPNRTHRAVAKLEKRGILSAVITQNIDGLHQAAGSENVLELHGSVHRNYCRDCGKTYPLSFILGTQGVPRCPECGGIVRPDVVLYEEWLNDETMERSVRAIEQADTLIIAGTSLAVYPAAGLIDCFRGDNLIVLNRTPTPADSRANLVIAGDMGDAWGE